MNGPYDTERDARASAHAAIPPESGWSILGRPQNRLLLARACRAAGVELGEFDRRILDWLSGFEDSTAAVFAGLITRAHAAGGAQRPEATAVTCFRCGSPITGYTDPYDGQTRRWRHARLPDPVAEFLDAEHGAGPQQGGAADASEDAGDAVWSAPADGRGNGLLDLTHPERSDLINVMTPDEIKVLLAYIAGYAPDVFDHAVTARSEVFADKLFGRIEDRDQAEYMAEPDGYCTTCGANASWFIGYEGPQHFRGPHKLVTGAERRELFTPEDGHAPQVGWRNPDEAPGGES